MANTTVSFPNGHVVSFPDSMPIDQIEQTAGKIWNTIKDVGGAVSESLGGPATKQQAEDTIQKLKTQPISQTVKDIGSDTLRALKPNEPAVLKKAQDAYKAGDYPAAVAHFLNYSIPFVGSGADRVGEELQSGQYSKATGHMLGIIGPMLVGDSVRPSDVPVPKAETAVAEAPKAAEYAGPERRSTPRTVMSTNELLDAIKNRKPIRTPFDDTEGAMKTIENDPNMPKLGKGGKATLAGGAVATALAAKDASAETDTSTKPQYNIVGTLDAPVSDKSKALINEVIQAAVPSVLPDSIVVLPTDKYTAISRQLANGSFNGKQVKSGSNQETFGKSGRNTTIGDGFSLIPQGRIYLDSQLLNNPSQLREVLLHELGHFAKGAGSNEDQANEVRDKVYDPRAKQAMNIWRQASYPGNLPRQSPTPLDTLSGVKPPTEEIANK